MFSRITQIQGRQRSPIVANAEHINRCVHILFNSETCARLTTNSARRREGWNSHEIKESNLTKCTKHTDF